MHSRPTMTLSQSIHHTKALQNRIHQFVEAYEKNCISQLHTSLHSSHPPPSPPIPRTHQESIEYLPRTIQEQSDPMKGGDGAEKGYEGEQMSRIFNEVSLGVSGVETEGGKKLKVRMQVDGNGHSFQVGGKQTYTLSNFNSFNNLKQPSPPDNHYDFQELLQAVETAQGRQLSEAGCKKILKQLIDQVQKVGFDSKSEELQKSREQSTLLDSTISHTNMSVMQAHHFDKALNPHLFSKNKGNKSNPLDTSISKTHPKTSRTTNSNRNQQNTMPILKKPTPLPIKQLKVIRKNNSSNPLTMAYQDLKGVDIFCIDNKIMGKERDRLIKAVQCNKTIVHLE